MARTIVKHESLLHPEMDTALAIEDEISRRLVQAIAVARLLENADPGHCGTVLQNAGWLLECLLNDAGELVRRLHQTSESRIAEPAQPALEVAS
jgi:hypothetical protein